MARLVEDVLRIDDATTQEALATVVVVVAEQSGLGVEDQARCGGGDIADVGG
jgi:hypothetical protein